MTASPNCRSCDSDGTSLRSTGAATTGGAGAAASAASDGATVPWPTAASGATADGGLAGAGPAEDGAPLAPPSLGGGSVSVAADASVAVAASATTDENSTVSQGRLARPSPRFRMCAEHSGNIGPPRRAGDPL